MTERHIIQLLGHNENLIGLASDGTVWVWSPVFSVWEPYLYREKTPATVPQPGEDPWG